MEALRTVVGICNEYLELDEEWGNSAVNLHLTQALMEIRDQLEPHIPIE